MEWICLNCGEINEIDENNVTDLEVCHNCGNVHYVCVHGDEVIVEEI